MYTRLQIHTTINLYLCVCTYLHPYISMSWHLPTSLYLYLSNLLSSLSFIPHLYMPLSLQIYSSISRYLYTLYLFISIYIYISASLYLFSLIVRYLHISVSRHLISASLSLSLFLHFYSSTALHIWDSVSLYLIYYILYIIYPRVCVPIRL